MALKQLFCRLLKRLATMLGCGTLLKRNYLPTAGKSNTMDRHNQYDPRMWRNGHDMGQGYYKLLPDHGKRFDRNNMRDLGYTLYQDFTSKNDPDTELRWWFRDINTWKSRIDRIEKMGYTAVNELTIT